MARTPIFTPTFSVDDTFETIDESPRASLSDEDFARIINATGLARPTEAACDVLRRELERVRALWETSDAAPRRLQPSRVTRKMRRIANLADELASALDEETLALLSNGLPSPASAPPGQRVLVVNDLEWAVRQLRGLSLFVAKHWSTVRGEPRKPGDFTQRRVVAGLARSFERAYDRGLGVGETGPGSRFVQEFFRVLGKKVSAASVKRWISVASAHTQALRFQETFEAMQAAISRSPNARDLDELISQADGKPGFAKLMSIVENPPFRFLRRDASTN